MKYGTYNKLHLYFQISETTWCLICFLGNDYSDCQINDVTGSCHLEFLNFQISFKFEFLYFKMMRKQHLKIEIKFKFLYFKMMRKQHLEIEIQK